MEYIENYITIYTEYLTNKLLFIETKLFKQVYSVYNL